MLVGRAMQGQRLASQPPIDPGQKALPCTAEPPRPTEGEKRPPATAPRTQHPTPARCHHGPAACWRKPGPRPCSSKDQKDPENEGVCPSALLARVYLHSQR